MRKNLQAGETDIAGIVILAVIILIIIATPKSSSNTPNGTQTWNWVPETSLTGPTTSGVGNSQEISGTQVQNSTYSSEIAISPGNAAHSYQPYDEYITLENRGRSPINITGWQLRNGKDQRTYYQGGSLQRFSADFATIPRGTLSLSPTGNSASQNIVLGSGERAIITTGSVGVTTPYRITSFKENICTGYIEALSDYAFDPPLAQNCPRPALEAGVENLDSACRTFINSLYSCRTPEFNGKTPDGKGTCETCVNGQILSSSCAAFVKAHFNYQGCMVNHSSDNNFSGRTWRVFLGRGWEMWAVDYESIELYDNLNQLVGFQNY